MTVTTERPLLPAATILLLRDATGSGATSLEVMMVKRHHQIDFASGALVFPGGKVAAGDHDVPPERIRSSMGVAEHMLPFYLAALRECFEECGVLLAGERKGAGLVDGTRAAALAPYRPLLDAGEISLGAFVEEEDLILEPDRLVPFAHWIGPKIAPKRFDTHFFLAAAPETQLAVHDGREAVDSLWISPADALDGQKRGDHTIIFPTRCNLDRLTGNKTTKDALAKAATDTIVTVEPWLENRDGGQFLCIPEEAGYSMTAESIETAFK